ncbi:hypothetical protein D3C80_1984230 [compost metagenome]
MLEEHGNALPARPGQDVPGHGQPHPNHLAHADQEGQQAHGCGECQDAQYDDADRSGNVGEQAGPSAKRAGDGYQPIHQWRQDWN